MDNLIENGHTFTISSFNNLINKNGFDDVHDSIACLSDNDGFFIVEGVGKISLTLDNNASTVCWLDNQDYRIVELINLIINK